MQPGHPLCVDCDGTLLSTDLLHEAVCLLMKQSPASLLLLPFWLLRGKAYMKHQMALRVRFDFTHLPVRQEIVALIKTAREQGRRVVLATASPQAWADGVAQQLGLFDEVIGSDEQTNLSASRKALRLTGRFGSRQFDYAGNGSDDLEVWEQAANGIVVSSSDRLVRAAAGRTVVERVIQPARNSPLDYIRALRVHQWLKNLLVFLPLASAHQLGEIHGLMQGGLAFLAFSLCASAVYVLNDLLDLESDRAHVRKHKRPFASTAIPVHHGVLMIPALLAASLLIALALPPLFLAVLAGYFVMTTAYSVRLKRQVIVDVMLLAALYTTRIIAGAAATQIPPSFWLLATALFIFLSLATVKRYSELLVTLQQNKEVAAGRGYTVRDLPVLMSIGVSSGIAAVMVLALFVNAPESSALYAHRIWLWLVPVVFLYWVTRIWMKAHRGEVDDDPVVFAARDWQSQVTGVMLIVLIWLAS